MRRGQMLWVEEGEVRVGKMYISTGVHKLRGGGGLLTICLHIKCIRHTLHSKDL